MNTRLTRRQMLQLAAGAVVMPVVSNLATAGVAAASSRRGNRVILVELSGANDGLNTLVPFSDDRYYKLRPVIGLKNHEFNRVDDDFALHGALQAAMGLWERGDLGIVQGLGYPSPNRSHFESIAIWETGSDGLHTARDGWATHALQHAYPNQKFDAHGISFGGGMNIFSSDAGTWLSLDSTRQLLNAEATNLIQTSVSSDRDASDNAALQTLLERNAQLQRAIGSIQTKLRTNRFKSRIAGRQLGRQLRHVVNMIAAGVNAPVYKVSLAGFDTHANQKSRHTRLLKELASGLQGAAQELQQMGEWSNTLIVTYSEFGRRARENHAGGTDHGTAAPHFVAGGAVQGGLWGDHPGLGHLQNDDLVHTMDYRALYNRLLSDWLEIDENNFVDYRDKRLDSLI